MKYIRETHSVINTIVKIDRFIHFDQNEINLFGDPNLGIIRMGALCREFNSAYKKSKKLVQNSQAGKSSDTPLSWFRLMKIAIRRKFNMKILAKNIYENQDTIFPTYARQKSLDILQGEISKTLTQKCSIEFISKIENFMISVNSFIIYIEQIKNPRTSSFLGKVDALGNISALLRSIQQDLGKSLGKRNAKKMTNINRFINHVGNKYNNLLTKGGV